MGAIRVYIVLKHHIQDIGFVRVQYIQNYYKRLSPSKTMTKCKICNKEMSLDEVVKASDPDIDNALCRSHLKEVFDRL